MRKALALLLTLVLISAAGVIAAHAVINPARDQVVIEEKVLYGDKMAADGLTVYRNTHWDNHLHWDTIYNISAENQCETEFDYTLKDKRSVYRGEYNSEGVLISNSVGGGIGSGRGISEDMISDHFPGWEELIFDVMEQAPAGEEYSARVLVADYYEFFPLSIDLDLREPIYYMAVDETGSEYANFIDSGGHYNGNVVGEAVRDFIKIPVGEGERVVVTVNKLENGAVVDVSMNMDYDDEAVYTTHYSSRSVVADTGIYFLFSESQNIDFSHVPGGCGIYCIPFGEPYVGENLSSYPMLASTEVSMVYPMDENAVVLSMFLDHSGEKLLLVTAEDGKVMLSVIELSTMERLQFIQIDEYKEDAAVWYIDQSESHLMLDLYYSRIALLDITESGEYVHQFTVDRAPEGVEIDWYRYASSVAYDGERLARAWTNRTGENPYDSCGFGLAIYDKTGLLYLGDYENSLTPGFTSHNYEYICQPDIHDHLLLEWK